MWQQSSAPAPWGYTGKHWNANVGLLYLRARWYDPTVGRFTQADRIVPNPLNSQAWNRYAYGLNNPLRYTDPSGYCADGQDDPIIRLVVPVLKVDHSEGIDILVSVIGLIGDAGLVFGGPPGALFDVAVTGAEIYDVLVDIEAFFKDGCISSLSDLRWHPSLECTNDVADFFIDIIKIFPVGGSIASTHDVIDFCLTIGDNIEWEVIQ
jgi:RHS repeat-associated protein